jgi:beta-glucosidase
MLKKKLLLVILLAGFMSGAKSQTLPYQNPQLSAAQRADDLLTRLTLEEKVSLMMDTSPAISRLGIPQFQWWNEALHGVGRNSYATVFPITMAMAASWDDALLHQVFTAVSDEARVKAQQAKRSGNIKRYQSLSFWTPNINIFRDPRWGRGQETYGEDPFLTAKMGLAVVRGLQGMTYDGRWLAGPENPVSPEIPGKTTYKKLLACAKHFAVHSGPEWNRHTFNVENLPERDLWETYLPAFKALVQEGEVAEIMCAYQRIDGQPCCSQTRYEQQILRDEWGFDGIITSDCGAIRDFLPRWHNTAKDGAEASAQAVLAGTDVECGSEYRNLPAAVKRGDIKEADLDRSLRRLLIARFELGDFDSDDLNPWTKIPESVVASKEHKALALDMALKSIVLLQNRNQALPLSGETGSSGNSGISDLVVMGPNANDSVMMWGNYSGYPTRTITALEGITRKAKALTPNARVRYIQGCGLTRNEAFESRLNELRDPLGNRGLQATYWNNTEMEGVPAVVTRIEGPVRLSNGGNTVFAPGVNLEQFSGRFDATFIPTRDETLSFEISGDDKIRLLVNGDTLVNIWSARQRIQRGKKELSVKAGEHYRIQIDYVQEAGYGGLNFDIVSKLNPTPEQLLAQIGETQTIIFVGGISPSLEGEEMRVSEPGFRGGDRESIELPQAQRDVLATLHKAGKRVIFVNCSGSAMGLVPETESCDAILQWWYAGEQGGEALADVLFGDKNPCGRLPITFYKSTNDLPDFLDYTMKNRTYRYFQGEPLFPFGYGLSYTAFAFGKPTYSNNKVRVNVKNTGTREGLETVQVYLRRVADTNGPLKSLRAYQQVSLTPGEAKTLTIPLPRERFEGWDEKTNTMRVVPGKYEIFVGTSSADKDLQKITVTIK